MIINHETSQNKYQRNKQNLKKKKKKSNRSPHITYGRWPTHKLKPDGLDAEGDHLSSSRRRRLVLHFHDFLPGLPTRYLTPPPIHVLPRLEQISCIWISIENQVLGVGQVRQISQRELVPCQVPANCNQERANYKDHNNCKKDFFFFNYCDFTCSFLAYFRRRQAPFPISPCSGLSRPGPASASYEERKRAERPEKNWGDWSSDFQPLAIGRLRPFRMCYCRRETCSLFGRASPLSSGIWHETLQRMVIGELERLDLGKWGSGIVIVFIPKRVISSSWKAGTCPKGCRDQS